MHEISELSGGDAGAMTDLAIRSKSHWRYTEQQMAVFRRELSFTADTIQARTAFGIKSKDRLTAFYTLRHVDRDIELEHMFVDPRFLKRGLGSKLFEHARKQAQHTEATHLTIMSDPHAAGFYTAMGCELTKEIPSSIPGRTIPLFRLRLR